MKILFAVKSKAMENLGAMYLASVAKQCGHEAKIVTFSECVVAAIDWNPDVVGFSSMTGSQGDILTVASMVRDYLPKVKIIVGGPGATFFPKHFQGSPDIDVIVPGEGENWMADFLGSEIRYPDLDNIPHPDRTCFPNMEIRDFIASRGCQWKCRYCSQAKWHDLYPELPRVQYRSVEDVVIECYNVGGRFNYFQDSAFGLDIKWLREFAPSYKRVVNTPFHCHARPSQITREYACLLSDAGCYSIRFALETSSDRLRKLIGREHTSDKEAISASLLLKGKGIRYMIQNILALPTSTIEDDLATLETNIECGPDYAWASIFVPFPGTELGDQCVTEGWFDGDYSKITDSFFNRSVLNFSDEYKEQTYFLQKCFALAVETATMPRVDELTEKRFPELIHRMMRRKGDHRLYSKIF